MASFVSTAGVGLVSCGKLPCMEGLKQRGLINGRTTYIAFPVHKSTASKSGSPRIVVVKAEGQTINPEIRKNEEKWWILLSSLSSLSPLLLVAGVGGRELSLYVMEVM